MSVPQKAFDKIPEIYFQTTGAQKPMQDRSRAERQQFNYAMCEMGRLYAFDKCSVIVDPVIEPADTFPEHQAAFGFINSRPYAQRGWCFAEFAIAHHNKRIVNLNDPLVQEVLFLRTWPKTVKEYAAQMNNETNEPPVAFTNKGDVAVVLFNYSKMTN
eukprot:3501588-Prymnesium_polylepis.1